MDAALLASMLTAAMLGFLLGRFWRMPPVPVCEQCGWPKDRMVCQGCADRTIKTLAQYTREVVADRDRGRAALAGALEAHDLLIERDFQSSPGKPRPAGEPH